MRGSFGCHLQAVAFRRRSLTEIFPAALYTDAALTQALGIRRGTLARARREGRLRHFRAGNVVLYRGEWVLDWIGRGAADRQVPAGQEAAGRVGDIALGGSRKGE